MDEEVHGGAQDAFVLAHEGGLCRGAKGARVGGGNWAGRGGCVGRVWGCRGNHAEACEEKGGLRGARVEFAGIDDCEVTANGKGEEGEAGEDGMDPMKDQRGREPPGDGLASGWRRCEGEEHVRDPARLGLRRVPEPFDEGVAGEVSGERFVFEKAVEGWQQVRRLDGWAGVGRGRLGWEVEVGIWLEGIGGGDGVAMGVLGSWNRPGCRRRTCWREDFKDARPKGLQGPGELRGMTRQRGAFKGVGDLGDLLWGKTLADLGGGDGGDAGHGRDDGSVQGVRDGRGWNGRGGRGREGCFGETGSGEEEIGRAHV